MIRFQSLFPLVFIVLQLPEILFAGNLPDLYQMVNPAVVDIVAISMDNVAVSADEDRKVASGDRGSGVLIDDRGTILTASHVIQTAEKITVTFPDGQSSAAEVVVSVSWGDVAVLQLTDDIKLPKPVVLADSDKVRIGDKVFVVGSPLGFSHSLSVGYISSRFQTGAMLGAGSMEVFQTDAAMNPGNSGGPLFNMDGEVIGIASHISTVSGGFQGLAFAVTSNQCLALLDRAETWSGIEGIIVHGRLARLLNVPQEYGLLVKRVSGISWGGKIGLQPSDLKMIIEGEEFSVGGDIILKVGEMTVNNDPDFFKKLGDYTHDLRKAGKKLTVTVLRGGQIVTLEKGLSP